MLKNNSKRVYIVNNIKSDYIEQAIFILKNDDENTNVINIANGSDIAFEAQNIINSYAEEIKRISLEIPSSLRFGKRERFSPKKIAVAAVGVFLSVITFFIVKYIRI